jgi:hypothetical protein
LLSIAQEYHITTGDIFFVPYYLNKELPVYSNKNLSKNKYGCKNFACDESMICVVFPFPNAKKDILADGFEIYVRKRND